MSVDLFCGSRASREMLQNVFPSLSPKCRTTFAIRGQLRDCCHESLRIFRFNHDSGAGFFDNLPRLTVDAKYHRTGAGHEFQHLGWNHGFEDVGLLQKNETSIRGRDEGGNYFVELQVKED